MGNRINMSFFKAYIELDKACAEKLDEHKKSGVSAYIGRLVELRFAPERSEVLPKLIKYRNFRNAMAHEENAFADISEISKEDVKWITRFTKSVNQKHDPVSRYERKARNYALWRKIRVILFAVLGVGFVVAAYFILKTLGIV